MPLGMITLLVILALVYFGTAHRILDRMRLNDKQALLFLAAMIAGSFIDIPIMASPVEVTINVGGALLPIGLCLWLLWKADSTGERVRGILAAIAVAAIVLFGSRYMPHEPETMFFDPKLIYGITAGIVAYLIGRSRRSAFIGGVMGIVFSDIAHMSLLLSNGIAGTTAIGGAGMFDVIIIAGLVAVMTAELIGETRERFAVHPEKRMADVYEFSEELTPDGKERRLRMVSNPANQQNKEGDTK